MGVVASFFPCEIVGFFCFGFVGICKEGEVRNYEVKHLRRTAKKLESETNVWRVASHWGQMKG